MERLPTRLEGLVLLAPQVHGDVRGFFVETFRANAWAAEGVPTEFVQDNHSRSRRGTVRGLHFQTHPGQGKLVRAARGHVLDAGIRFDDPDVGVEWPQDLELLYSARDREAPRLADVADTLPFRYQG